VLGTVHDAETDQLPQSTRPVLAWLRQVGCAPVPVCDTLDWTRRAPAPP
jgi:hypothetical protein